MMRGKVLCTIQGGKCGCIHQYYHELRKFHDGQVFVGHFCKTPFVGGMEINIFLILPISEKMLFCLCMWSVSIYMNYHSRVM